jgi:hypothetical protein
MLVLLYDSLGVRTTHPGEVFGAMAGGELDAVVTVIGALPADTAGLSDAVLAERMRRLVAARAMLDAALVEQLADSGGR